MQAARVPSDKPAEPGSSRWSRVSDLLPFLTLVGITAVGLFMRWDRLAYAEYNRDQAYVLNKAYDFVTRGEFPLVGIRSSLGPYQGPMEIYLLSIPVAFSKDPIVASAFVGLLQMAAVVLTYFFVKRYFGRTTALVTVALFAINPWVLEYGRKVWTPNTAPIFAVSLYFCLYKAVVDHRRYCFALTCPLAVILFLTHPSGIYFAPLLGLVFLLFWRRIGLRPLLLGGVLSAIAASPYLLYELQNHFVSIRSFLSLSRGESQIDLELLRIVTTTVSARAFPTMMGFGFRGDWQLPDQTVQNELATWLLYLGLAVCVWRVIGWRLLRFRSQGGAWESYALLLLWFFTPVVLFLRHSFEFYPHYSVNVWPVQFILVGLALTHGVRAISGLVPSLRARGALLAGAACTAVVLFLGVSQFIYFRTYLDYVVQQEPLGKYAIPLLYSQRIVDNVRLVRAEMGGAAPAYAYSARQWEPLQFLSRPDLDLWEIDPREGLALPRDPARGALFVLADDSIVASDKKPFVVKEDTLTLQRLRDLGFVELSERGSRGPGGYAYFRLFQLTPERARQALAGLTRPQQLLLGDGTRLLGYALTPTAKAGEKVTLAALWDVPAAALSSRDRFGLLARLVDPAGRAVVQQEWEVARYGERFGRADVLPWRESDLPLTYYELVLPAGLPPGEYSLELGAHRQADGGEGRWMGADGLSLGPTHMVGTIRVAP